MVRCRCKGIFFCDYVFSLRKSPLYFRLANNKFDDTTFLIKPIEMKKFISSALLITFSCLFIQAVPAKVTSEAPAIVKRGYQSTTSFNGYSVTVYVEWNTALPLGSRVEKVTVLDVWGTVTFTTTSWDQYPKMNLVSSVLVASGWRCNFNPSGDYAVLNGNLTMY
jgi:hypothetical protein